MPQMPNGPGAPSDVGPDGGLVDPGMIGPDGMPVDGGPPPGEGDPDGDGPPGAPEDDGGGGAPGGGSEDDDSGDGPPPPPKSKKKSSKAYRGVSGQALTEGQLIRHVAVVASGRDPRVLARLRADARPGRVLRFMASFGEDLVHHRTLSSGHEVSLGRRGEDWYGFITAPHPHERHSHMMYLGREDDPRAAADRALSRRPARDFVRSTSADLGEPAAGGYHSPEWPRSPGAGTAPQEWRPAIAARTA